MVYEDDYQYQGSKRQSIHKPDTLAKKGKVLKQSENSAQRQRMRHVSLESNQSQTRGKPAENSTAIKTGGRADLVLAGKETQGVKTGIDDK